MKDFDSKITNSLSKIDKRISCLRSENAERLKRLEKVNSELNKLLAVRDCLNALLDVADTPSDTYYKNIIEDLVKSRYI